ncbi:hypothetical protein VE04_06335 [Pseudogymnoascus sp. 24MN13]|nr:hypothetical protein VE04_06335 [Pseudogymnoascus sp. 24MN13]
MALIEEGFVSANTYNSLPTIQEAADVPREYAADLGYLQRLLARHNVPESISIRLIHRHYDIADGEAMVFRDIALPAHGTVEVMRATSIASAQLHGKNFLVSSAARLQAYEYATEPTIDLSTYETFIAEFVETVVHRKLQHRFGLKVNHRGKIEVKADQKEFEFPEEQCTITIPTNLPLPEARTSSASTRIGAPSITSISASRAMANQSQEVLEQGAVMVVLLRWKLAERNVRKKTALCLMEGLFN